jgi:thymidylate synthase (FAD)
MDSLARPRSIEIRRVSDAIGVLDHGYVRLVDHMGSDLSVVRSARVSYDAGWRAGMDQGSDARLINYLWQNAHTTPFESVTFTFEVKAPIFVFRQWHRHRTWTYNELSARYRELPEEFYVPKIEDVGTQSGANKQGRDLSIVHDSREAEIAAYTIVCQHAFHMYKAMLTTGWPRELARMILPVSTYSHMFATVNLHNLFKFMQLRIHPHAQQEIREYALGLRQLIAPIVPVCLEAFDNKEKARGS